MHVSNSSIMLSYAGLKKHILAQNAKQFIKKQTNKKTQKTAETFHCVRKICGYSDGINWNSFLSTSILQRMLRKGFQFGTLVPSCVRPVASDFTLPGCDKLMCHGLWVSPFSHPHLWEAQAREFFTGWGENVCQQHKNKGCEYSVMAKAQLR